ncbi:MAG: radical SAM protein [Candidatus Portnoybacteria bacterium]|nr:radical SAM protein [Candidatus Portnoybacteria bacterium]MDD4982864.1 radical SAM protein [Candidatus Portnoybacteria bacterium]
MNLKKIIGKSSKFFAPIRFFGGPSPLFLLVHLTLECNCDCAFCYQKNGDFYRGRKGFMALGDFERILKEAKKFFIKPRIHLFGGEPLLHPEFEKIVKSLDAGRFRFSLTTNGVMLGRRAEILSSSRLDQINVSLDDLGETHDEARKLRGCFELALAGIKKMRALEKGKRNKKIINVNCLIGENNFFRLAQIARYFADNRIEINLLSFQHPYFAANAKPTKLNSEEIAAQMSALEKMDLPFDVIFVPAVKKRDLADFYFPAGKDRFKKDCFLPWLGLSLLPDLDVSPGGGVLGCNFILGNLKSAGIKEIWQGPALAGFRKQIKKGGLPAICGCCCHRRYY